MSAISDIPRLIAEAGRNQAAGQRRGGEITAQLFSQLGQIAASVPQQMAQAEEQKQQQAVRAQQMQIGQMNIDAQKRAIQINDQVNGLMQNAMTKNEDGTYTFDQGRLSDSFTQAKIPLPDQERALKSINEVNSSLTAFSDARKNQLADLANGILVSAGDGPISPELMAFGIAHAKANRLVTDDQLKPLIEASARGEDLKPYLQDIRGISEKYKELNKPIALPRQSPGMFTPATGKITPVPQTAVPPTEAVLDAEYQRLKGKEATGVELTPEERGTLVGYEERKRLSGKQSDTSSKVGSFEDYVQRTYGDDPTPTQILAARKAYGQADDRQRVSVSVENGGGLSSDAIPYIATQYRMLGSAGIPTRLGEGEKIKILNEAAKQIKVLGQSPAAAVTKQLANKSDAASLTQLTKMAGAAEAFESKALGQIEIIRDLSKKVPRTSFPIINSALQSGRMNITGNADATKLANAISTFSAEYAKLIEGSTGSAAGSSDAARRATEKLINAGMGQGTMSSVLDLMEQEMRLTRQGYDVAKQHRMDNLSGGAVSSPASSGGVNPFLPKK